MRPWTPTSGTFFESATRDSSDNETHCAYASKSVIHDLRIINDNSEEHTIGFARSKSSPCDIDGIRLTSEVRVEAVSSHQTDRGEDTICRWTSVDTAVEKDAATILAQENIPSLLTHHSPTRYARRQVGEPFPISTGT